jgi:hypothetical protein
MFLLFTKATAFSFIDEKNISIDTENVDLEIFDESKEKIFYLTSVEEIENFIIKKQNVSIYFANREFVKQNEEVIIKLSEASGQMSDYGFYVAVVYIDDIPDAVQKFKLRYMPTVLVFAEGKLVCEIANRIQAD